MNNNGKFFELLFNEQHIKFRCLKSGGAGKVDANGGFNQHIIEVLKQANEQNFEVYFVVNSGGYKDNEINKFNAVFIDLDCGRNKDNEYFPLSVVQDYKEKKLEQLREFKFRPTAINETRNGLQVFWALKDGATVDQFNQCENRLISYFDADIKVKNPARLMRVPEFYWCKDVNNKYLAKILELNDVRYGIAEIIAHLPEPEKREKRNNNKKEYSSFIVDPKTSFAETNVSLIQEGNIQALQEILEPEQTSLNSHEEVYDYLKKQDLFKFLGVSGVSFKCIIHQDKKPSAGILVNDDTGHYIYNCFSSSCGFKGTIIQVTEALTGLNRVQVLRFLRKVYKIDYIETEWQKEQKAILEENMRFLMSDEFSEFYPEIYKVVKNYIPQLCIIHLFAQDKVFTENFSDNENNAVFFASIRHLANLTQKDKKLITNRLGLFSYLGLIKKLQDTEIPDFLFKQAKSYARAKHYGYITTFYSIPSYCDGSLSFSKEKALEYKEKGFTMKGWSRELILRTLGEDEANRVFPQQRDVDLPEINEDIAKRIERIALNLISKKGWTTEKEILLQLRLNFVGQKKFKETLIKKVLPELIDKYCLTKKRLSKDTKEKYRIECKGYPYILTFSDS